MGEGGLDFKFLPAGGQFHLRGSDEALGDIARFKRPDSLANYFGLTPG